MANQGSNDELRAAIIELQNKKEMEILQLKQQLQQAYESVKPANFIKSTIKGVSSSKEMERNLTNAAIVLVSSYLSKKLYSKMAKSPVKRLIGAAILLGITNVVARNPEKVKALGVGLFRLIKSKYREARD